ncbi:hypothetical protein ACP4OV_003020 [Aristida adscensionis]
MAIPPFAEKLLASIAWDALKALWDYLFKYGRVDVEKLVKKMQEILEDLKFLSNLEDPAERTNQWIIDARELVCDIEDVISKCKDPADKKAAKNKLEEIAEKIMSTPTYFSLSGHIKQSTDDATAAEERYRKVNMALGGGREDLRYTPLRQPPYPGFVGIDHRKKKIISLLNVPAAAPDDEPGKKPIGHMVVSIAGVGGLGKTTLAAQVCYDITKQFHCEARVFVSRNRRPKEILISLLQEFGINHGGLSACDATTLVGLIQNHVQDKRFLVVLDDVWDTHLLKDISNAFFGNKCGGRIIITTRNNDVANEWCSFHEREDKERCSSVGGCVYQIKPLNNEESRKLLLQDVPKKKPQISKEYVDKILTKCDGSPLALAAASGLVVQQKRNTIQWREVYRTISKIKGDPKIQRMRVALSHSYFDLPYDKRDCLLYLSLFPNDEINKKRLVSRWVAEGLIDEEEGKTTFEDLISRNLILPPEIKYDGDVSTYQVHHTIHDFVVWKSAEYNFITLPSAIDQTDRKIRRISVHKNTKGGFDIKQKNKELSHLRSLSLYGPGDLPKKVPSILRVLDLENCPNADLKSPELFHDNLKYLKISEGLKGFKCAKPFENYLLREGAEGLLSPGNLRSFVTATQDLERIGSARHLQTLDLRGMGDVKLDAAITDLAFLVRLLVDPQTTLPNEIRKMRALEELELINISSYDLNVLEELSELPKLRTMGIYLSAGSPSVKDSKLLESIITLVKREEGLRSLFIDGDFKTPISIDPRLWGQVLQHLRKFRVRCPLSAVPKLKESCKELERLRLGVPVINLDTEVTMLAEFSSVLTHLFLDLYGSPQGLIKFYDIKRFQYLACLGLGVWSNSLNMTVKFPMGAPQHLKIQLHANDCKKPEDLPDGFNYSTTVTPLAGGGNDKPQVATTWTTVHITTRPHQGNENKEVQVAIEIESRSATLRITENESSSNNGHTNSPEDSTDKESTSASAGNNTTKKPADISTNNCICTDSTATWHREGKQLAIISPHTERIVRNGNRGIAITEPKA